MAPVLSIESLRKSYGSFQAVRDVSFQVEEGEIFGILGPNGAGKTTSVECVQALRTYDAGNVSVLGLDPRHHAAEIRRRIGSQLQESALPDRIKVWEALDLFGSLSDEGPSPDELLADWGLTDKKTARFDSLSGGQQQMLAIGRGLVGDPKVVLLDEPSLGLSPLLVKEIFSIIRRLNREQGVTMMLVEQNARVALEVADYGYVLETGTIALGGGGQELLRDDRVRRSYLGHR